MTSYARLYNSIAKLERRADSLKFRMRQAEARASFFRNELEAIRAEISKQRAELAKEFP